MLEVLGNAILGVLFLNSCEIAGSFSDICGIMGPVTKKRYRNYWNSSQLVGL